MTKKSTQSFLTLDKRLAGTVFVDELARVRLCGFALALDRLAKANTFAFNANLRTAYQTFLLVVSSPLLLLKSVTNLFKP